MELPSVQFSDVLCPRSKQPPRSKPKSKSAADVEKYEKQQLAAQVILHDANKAYMFPVGRDAFLTDIFQPDSLVLKYGLSQGELGRILCPVGTCLPFGKPNHVATLQDHCSSIIPLAVQTQEWLQGFTQNSVRSGRTSSLPQKRKAGSPSSESASDDGDDTEGYGDYDGDSGEEDADDGSESETSASSESSEEEDIEDLIFNLQEPVSDEESMEDKREERSFTLPPSLMKKAAVRVEAVVEVDPSLPFDELAHLPNFKYIKPLRKDRDNIRSTYLKTRASAGFEALPPLNSSINWWYSGGNLAQLTSEQDQHFLLHSAGGSFRQKTSLQATPFRFRNSGSFRCVTAAKKGQVQLEVHHPILQIDVQNIPFEEPLVLSRQARKCQVLQASLPETGGLSFKAVFSIDNDQLPRVPLEPYYYTHATFSPYVPSEFLVATQTGQVSLYSTAHDTKLQTFSIALHEFKKSAVHTWTGCYFAAVPRLVGLATPAAVQLFDLRSNLSQGQLQLIKKSEHYTDVADNIVAADIFPSLPQFHVVLSSKEMLVIDERFASQPVIRYPSQATTTLAYLKGLRGGKGESSHDDVVCSASQMSQEVMVHQMELGGGKHSNDIHIPPHMLSVPFLCAAPRQLSAQCALVDLSMESAVKHRLEKPITGMELLEHPSGAGFSCVTVTSLGDVFMQSFTVKEEMEEKENVGGWGNAAFSAVHSECTMNEAEQAHLRKWLKKASGSVEDATSHQNERAFYPDINCDLTEDLLAHLQYSSLALLQACHPECPRCNDLSQDKQDMPVIKKEVDAPVVVCPRCHLTVNDERPVVSTGPNPFCYYRKNTSQAPVPLPEEFQRDVKLREMARYNRLLHRLMTECYKEDIPRNLLQPPSPVGTSSDSSDDDEGEKKPIDKDRPDPFGLRSNLSWKPGTRLPRGNNFGQRGFHGGDGSFDPSFNEPDSRGFFFRGRNPQRGSFGGRRNMHGPRSRFARPPFRRRY